MLPKYVHLFYAEDKYQFQSNGAVVHECIFRYQVEEFCERHGYDTVSYEIQEQRWLLRRNNHAA